MLGWHFAKLRELDPRAVAARLELKHHLVVWCGLVECEPFILVLGVRHCVLEACKRGYVLVPTEEVGDELVLRYVDRNCPEPAFDRHRSDCARHNLEVGRVIPLLKFARGGPGLPKSLDGNWILAFNRVKNFVLHVGILQ